MSEKVFPPNPPKDDPKRTDQGKEPEIYSEVPPDPPSDPLSPFQGAIYASFVLTFCLAGFASVILYRKALKTKVLRFSMAAKVLALSFVGVALVNFFAIYLFNNYLNGGDINAPTICGMLVWALIGPAIAIILNSLLTREDSPGKIKMFLDAFVYLIIFGCIIVSMSPDLEKNKALIFSFLGAFFFIIPIARFLTALSMAKVRHPEVREVFIQILIYVLLFLPLLLPGLTITNAYGIVDGELGLFLINFIVFSFILIAGLLMIIAVDYVTQGINPEQLISVAEPKGKAVPTFPPPPTRSGDGKPISLPPEESVKPVESDTPKHPKPQPVETDSKPEPVPSKPSVDPKPKDEKSSSSGETPKPPNPLDTRIKAPIKPKKRF